MLGNTRGRIARALVVGVAACGAWYAAPSARAAVAQEKPAAAKSPADAAFDAGIALHQSNPAAAEAKYREAIRLFTASGDALKAAHARNNLAGALYAQGKTAEAIAEMKASLAALEKLPDVSPIETADALENLAAMHIEGGDAAGEPYLDRALAAYERALGPDDPGVVARLEGHANYYESRGNHAREAVLREKLVAHAERASGKDSDEAAEALSDYGYAAMRAGDATTAETAYTRALAIREALHGKDSFAAAASAHNLGELANSKGDYARAEAFDRRALAVFEKEDTGGAAIAYVCSDVGGVLSHQKKFAEAEPFFVRALATGEKAFGAKSQRLAPILLNYARMLRDAGRAAEAAKLETRVEGLQPDPEQ